MATGAVDLPGDLANLLVWTDAWFYYARLAGGRSLLGYLGTPGRWYVYLLSLRGLSTAVTAAVALATQIAALATRPSLPLLAGQQVRLLPVEAAATGCLATALAPPGQRRLALEPGLPLRGALRRNRRDHRGHRSRFWVTICARCWPTCAARGALRQNQVSGR